MATDSTTHTSGAQTLRANGKTAQSTALGSDGNCPFYKRTGFAILPVRYAAIPSYLTNRPANVLAGTGTLEQFADKPMSGHKYTLRTLRRGFVHVFLGATGLWQIYATTDAGYLRKLANPDDPDHKTDRELTPACMREGHNVPASFINVPPGYPKVWLAFSETVWTRKVRSRIEKQPSARMQMFTVDALASAPDAQPHAFELTPSATRLSELVEEYASTPEACVTRTSYVGIEQSTHSRARARWDSAFGLQGRGGRPAALGKYAQTCLDASKATHKKERKVPVVALFDPVGILKEINQTRLHFVSIKQAYCVTVMRKLIVSQSIDGLEKIIRQSTLAQRTAAEKAKGEVDLQTHYVSVGEGFVPPYSYTDTRADRAKEDADAAWARLEKRLKPGEKAKFDAEFNAAIATFDQWIGLAGADWAAWARDSEWMKRFADYDSDVEEQRTLLLENHAACLAGGITEGKSAEVWKQWLAKEPFDVKNPIYRILFGDRKTILEFVRPSDGKVNKGDKLYDTVKGLTNSTEFKATAKAAAAQVSLALSGALSALGTDASRLAHDTAMRAHQAAMLMYQRVEATFLKVQMTVGEYQHLLADLAFKKMTALDRAVQGVLKDGDRVVKSVAIAGVLGIPNAVVRDKLIEVVIWTFDKLEDIKARLDGLAKSAGSTTNRVLGAVGEEAANVLRTVRVASISINHEAERVLGAVEGKLILKAGQLRQFSKDLAGRALRTAAGGGEIYLAVGSLIFQSWAVKDGLHEVEEKVGHLNADAQLSLLSAGVGTTGAAAELTGAVAKKFGAKFGEELIMAGGVIAAAASIVDGVQAAMSSLRAFSKNDRAAGYSYGAASFLFLVGGGIGVYASIVGASSLIGPFGIALGLIVIGVIALWAAINAESTVAEIWMDRCVFGAGLRSEGKWTDKQVAEELEHLNAIVIGLGAEVGFSHNLLGIGKMLSGYDTVKVKVTFGGFEAARSALEWTLWMHHKDGRKFAVVGGRSGLSPIQAELRAWDGKRSPDDIESWFKNFRSAAQTESGALSVEHSVDVRTDYFQRMSVDAVYWVDKADDGAVAKLHLEEPDAVR